MNQQINPFSDQPVTLSMMISETVYRAVSRIERTAQRVHELFF